MTVSPNASKTAGCTKVKIHPTKKHQIVYGEWLGAGYAPTILVYGHYDVQPEDPVDLWDTPPFEPTVKKGKLFARGAADDKGQVHLHLWAARAWMTTEGRLPLNLRFVFEGEEEEGSPNFEAWLEANTERLAGDLVVVTDTGFYEGNHPALTVSLRGNTYFQIDVTGPSQDLHSGGFGGMVQNPANALIRIMASLRDGDGRVTVPGFYDDAPVLSETERAEFERLPLPGSHRCHGLSHLAPQFLQLGLERGNLLPQLFHLRLEILNLAAQVALRDAARRHFREDIEQIVGRINGEYGEPGWVPVSYLYRTIPFEELIAYYVAADVMLVTPLRDGMNLVAKEYVATRYDETGALVLSEFAGAAVELKDALLVNPHDIDGVVGERERRPDVQLYRCPLAEPRLLDARARRADVQIARQTSLRRRRPPPPELDLPLPGGGGAVGAGRWDPGVPSLPPQ